MKKVLALIVLTTFVLACEKEDSITTHTNNKDSMCSTAEVRHLKNQMYEIKLNGAFTGSNGIVSKDMTFQVDVTHRKPFRMINSCGEIITLVD